jgi:CRP-like cAMP-binding protein
VDTDGWYLIFSGQCSLYLLSATRDEAALAQIPPATLALLRQAFGPDKWFTGLGTRGPTEAFGDPAVLSSDVRLPTVVTDRASVLVRISPAAYRETIGWVTRSQLERKASLLAQVKELQVLRDSRELLLHLAETIEPVRFEVGTVINDRFLSESEDTRASFIVVEEGLLVKRRVVNFGQKGKLSKTTVRLPIGPKTVVIGAYGPRQMFPVPAMHVCVPYPVTLLVREPVSAYILKMNDLALLLLRVQTQRVMQAFVQEPSDDEVKEMWIQKQESVQWEAYRRACLRDARRILKTQRALANGEYAIRKARPPKAIKDHRPFAPLKRRAYEET